jgi:MoaA/NifB/PqqE/SkfB family radical SAM enzyme
MSKSFYFQWHITNLCNMRCLHCYQSDFSAQADLDFAGLKKVADNILSVVKQWDKKAIINLTGGEPFLKKELFPLLEYLDGRKEVKELAVITNGTCLDDKIVSALKKFRRLNEIKISLEAADEKLNDSIRGKGAFQNTLNAVKSLQPAKRIEKTLMFTLLRRNLSQAVQVLDLAQRSGANGVIFERFIPWGRGDAIREEVLTKDEWEGFVHRLLQFLEMPFDRKIFSYKAFWVRFKKTGPSLFGAPCVVADGGVCIMPNADVLPCRRFNLKIGNLLSHSLDQVYEGSLVIKDLQDRNKLKGKCGICRIKSCKGCRALAFALCGDYLAEDVQCQK